MNKDKIRITDNGNVIIPNEVKMSISEIADLLGVFYQTAKREIRAIEKSGVASGDCSMGGTVNGSNIYPEHYGLDMIIALAFRLQSPNADVFRTWIVKKASRYDIMATLVLPLQNATLN